MDNIVSGLFGLSPNQVQQQQQAAIQQQANAYAQQAPFERATAGMYRGGAGLAGIGAGMMGMVNPEVEAAQMRQDTAGKVAGMTVDQLRQYALTIPDPRMKMGIMAYADQKEAQQSTLAHQAAQTLQSEAAAAKSLREPTGTEKIQILDRLKKSYPDKTDEELLRMIDKKDQQNKYIEVGVKGKPSWRQKMDPETGETIGEPYQTSAGTSSELKLSLGGNNPYQLSDVQNEALFGENGAVTTGKLSPDRINSRSAKIFANAYIKNPNTDMVGLSATASLAKNPQIQQKSQLLMAIPEIMKNMVDSGKKVGFSDNRTVGNMQAFIKGEFNDPDYAEYMTQRNDALMTIAGVMRSTGMSDQAHKAEIEAASPTMNPAALDGWLRGQMKSLEPRLKIAQKFTRTEQTPVTPPRSSVSQYTEGQTATNAQGAKMIFRGGIWNPM